MKLYLISQDQNDDYDTYDSAIVAAKNEEQARDIDPCPYRDDTFIDWSKNSRLWAFDRDAVKIKEIGTAKRGTKVGLILSSFNAG